MTYDEIALRYLAAGLPIPAELEKDAAVASGSECPECGSHDTEDNGSTEYRCRVCDHRWGVDCGERYGY